MSSIFKGRMYVYVMQDIKQLFVAFITIFFLPGIETVGAVMTCTAVFVFIYFRHGHLDIALHDENIRMTFDATVASDPVILSAKYHFSRTAAIVNNLLARWDGIGTGSYKERSEEQYHYR